MRREHHHGTVVEQFPDGIYVAHHIQSLIEMPSAAEYGAETFPDGCVEQAVKESCQKTLRKAEGRNLESSDDFLGVPVDDFPQNFLTNSFGFGVVAVKRFFDQFFADSIPEGSFIGWIYFPGRFLDSNTLLVNGFYQHIRQIFAVPPDDPFEGMFINMSDKIRAIFAEQVNRPFLDALNDARVYFNFFFQQQRGVWRK